MDEIWWYNGFGLRAEIDCPFADLNGSVFLLHRLMKEYITGLGFIGRHLAAGLDFPTHIPHDQIDSARIEPFGKFYFLSTYGNMSTHTEEDRIIKANVSDLIHVLGQIDWKEGFDSFVYMSSSSVKLKVQTMYSRTKKAAEEILLAYAEKYSAPICIIRPFSVTGPGEQKEHLIPTLIKAAYSGETVNFVPKPVHDFIDVRDVVSGVLSLSSNKARGIFELGTGTETSNQEVKEMVERLTSKKINVNIVPQLRAYDNTEWLSMNYRARGYGWLPKYTLEQSITDMVKEYGVART